MSRPLLQIIKMLVPEYEDEFIEIIHKFGNRRLQDRSESLEAQLIRAILRLESEVNNGLLPVKVITEKLNEGKPDNRKFTCQRIGKRISAFGLSRGKTANGGAGVIWDKDKLEETAIAYGVDISLETSDSSVTNKEKSSNTDDSDESDVTKEIDLPF